LLADDAEVRRVSAPLPGLVAGSTVIASEDGSELYVFSPAGRILLTLSAMTGDTLYSFGYDQNRWLSTVRDLAGLVTHLQRDAAGKLIAIIPPNGQTTNVSVNADGNLSGLTGPDGHPVGFVLSANGNLVATINQTGDTVIRYQYDTNGKVVTLTEAAGGNTSFSSDDNSATLQLASNKTYSIASQPTADGGFQSTQVLGGSMNTQTIYAPDGRVVVTSPDGVVTTLTPSSDSRFGQQMVVGQETVRLPSGLTKTTRFARGVTLSDPDDPLSVAVEIDSAVINNRLSTTRFDKVANTVTTTTAGGRVSAATLDNLGRTIGISVVGGPTLERTLDGRGRVTEAAVGGRVTRYAYDSLDRVTEFTDVLGRTTHFAHNDMNQLIRRDLPDGRQISIAYDHNGNVTSVTPPSRPVHGFVNNAAGQVTTYTAPDAGAGPAEVRYSYDSAGRPVTITRPDSSVFRIAYNAADFNEVVVLPGNDTLKVIRDPASGNVTQSTLTGAVSVAHTYDGPLPTSNSWTGIIQGTVATGYDADFRRASERVNGGPALPFTYDADGLMNGVGALTITRSPTTGAPSGTTLGSVVTSATYQLGYELASLAARLGSDTFYAVVLQRDSAGRITNRSETINHVTSNTAFAYDSAARLATVTRDGVVIEAYEYDGNGNRIYVTTSTGSTISAFDVQDRITAGGSVQYEHTANGDLRKTIRGADTTVFAYDALGNLRSVSRTGLPLIEYVVDAEGNRVGKRVNGILNQSWLYNGGLVLAEFDGSGVLVSRFVYGDRPVPEYMVRAGSTYRIVSDERGSVRFVVDVATGVIAQRIDYDPFGRVTLNTNPGFQPFGFAGGLYDAETGLVRFGARDYDATIGRWTAKDPIGFAAEFNLYSYVFNDPVNWTDVAGLSPQSIIDITQAQVVDGINRRTAIQIPVYHAVMRKAGCIAFVAVISVTLTAAVADVVYVASTGGLDPRSGLLYIGRTVQELFSRLNGHHRDLQYLHAIITRGRAAAPTLPAIEATVASLMAGSAGLRAAIQGGLIANLRWPSLGNVLQVCR
jgi:RHS repeat-associated protein